MIGIGKWSVRVNTMLFKGEGTIEVIENNGNYDFCFELPEKYRNIKFKYYDIHEHGNTLFGKCEASVMPGKVIEVQATFDGDKMTGKIILPFFANKVIPIDGCRIA